VLLRVDRYEGLTILLVEQRLPFARRVGGPTDHVVKNHLTV
jgi:ABC-type branched-subunit amino acid transport system ATPase component